MAENAAPEIEVALPPYNGGDEFVVVNTVSRPENSQVIAFADGSFVVIWRTATGEGGDIYGQRYDANGASVGSVFLVPSSTTGEQNDPAVAVLADGGFVVVWNTGSHTDLVAQSFDAAGSKVGAEFSVGTAHNDTSGNRPLPAVAGLGDGTFIVTWHGIDAGKVFAHRHAPDASWSSGEFEVSTVTNSGGNSLHSSVAPVDGGGFAVAWESYGPDGIDADIFAAVFDADGSRLGPDTQINTYSADDQIRPKIVGLSNGGFVVAWTSEAQDDPAGETGMGVYAQVLAPDGSKVGGEFRANTYTYLDQQAPTISPLANGEFVIAWQSERQAGKNPIEGSLSWASIYAQRFAADGTKLGGEFILNETIAARQIGPSLAALPDGGFVAAWNSVGSADDVQARVFDPGLVAGDSEPISLKGTFSISDVDVGDHVMQAILGVQSGRINVLPGDSGVVVNTGDNNTAIVTFHGTLPQLNALLGPDGTGTVTYTAPSNSPPASTWLTLSVGDNGWTGEGGVKNDVEAVPIAIRHNEAPVARPDQWSGFDNVATAVRASINDSDAEGDPQRITHLNGIAVVDGQAVTLASRALVRVTDSVLFYDPNGQFDYLVSPESGANGNSRAQEVFSYTLNGGSTATVTFTVKGVTNPNGDTFIGYAGTDSITASNGNDVILVQQGNPENGGDFVRAMGGFDMIYFGAAFATRDPGNGNGSGDQVDGGTGSDLLLLQGNYTGDNAVTFASNALTGVEQIVLLPGDDYRFDATVGNFYSYSLTTNDAHIGAGEWMLIDGDDLRSGENMTFNGAAEASGNYLVYAGAGIDTLTGGGGGDYFVFGLGTFAATDTIAGGAGFDRIAFRGNYTGGNGVVLGTNFSGIEGLVFHSGQDTTFGPSTGDFFYEFATQDASIAAGQTMTIDGSAMRASESLVFNGSAEASASFTIIGGAGADGLRGGQGHDTLSGGAGNDELGGGFLFDLVTGGAGNDTFRYDSVFDSNAASRDAITDFTLGDLIDLHRIDAATNLAGDQAFSFIADNAFHGIAGELRAINPAASNWIVQGDTDGNGVSDFEISVIVADASPIVASDFVL